MLNVNDPDRPIVIDFRACIYQQQADKLASILCALQNSDIKEAQINISSPGGNISVGLGLSNLLKSLPIEFTTHNIGMVDSISNALFVAGKIRYANANSRFLMHGVTRDLKGATEVDLEEALSFTKRDHDAIVAAIAESTNLKVEQIKQMFRGETLITPEDAKSYGIIDEIKEAEIPTGALIVTVTDPPENDRDAQYLLNV